jgi:hypothetical protein
MIGATEFIAGTPSAGNEILINISQGACEFVDMVKKAYGHDSVYLVKPSYVMSTDDTTQYIFSGTNNNSNEFYLVSDAGISGSGTRSPSEVSDSQAMNGFRIKLTVTITKAGEMAPIFCSVFLSEKELPTETCPEGFLVLPIKGLAVGSATDVFNQQLGYVCFIRRTGESSADLRRYKHYRNAILLPFIKELCLAHDYHEPGNEVPEELTAVSYCDGDLPQIAAIVDELKQETENLLRVINNKQNAARSTTEQAADLSKVFKFLKFLCNVTTSVNEPPSRLKKEVQRALLDILKNTLQLQKTHSDALIDFLSVIPRVLAKVATPDVIREGWLEGGYADFRSKQEPDF